tara:strand:- start:8720 stop:10570 length:1851 start_codon:yes stop_codon:yes gene_type:complete
MSPKTSFEAVGRQVSWRLLGIQTIRSLNLTVTGVVIGLLTGFIALRILGLAAPEFRFAVAALVVWMVATLAFNLWRKANPFRSLATWDEASGGKNVFSSAQFFENQEGRSVGEVLHLQQAQELLSERLENLEADLPLPKPSWNWLGVPLIFLFLLTPFFRQTIRAEDLVMSEEMAAQAKEEANQLAEQQARFEKLKELIGNQEERTSLEELAASLEGTAEMLDGAGEKSSREILNELEARARAAERIASKLGAEDGEWASSEMLSEMASHADTADLAAALQDQNAASSANEADRLAEKLADQKLTGDAKRRIDQALRRTMAKASEEDRARPVGEHVGNASERLTENQPEPAAQDFRNLSDHFREVEHRQRAESELKELAEQLRQSGNEIAQSQMEQMKELGREAPKPPPGVQNLADAEVPQVPPTGPQGTPQALQAPGPQNQPNQQPGMEGAPVPGMQPPVPGQQPENQQLGMAPVPGQTPKPGEGQPGMMAPVPGQAPGSSAPSNMLGGVGSAIGAPGLEAGFGSAEMKENRTEALNANKDALVDAVINADGESTMQTVQGGTRSEAAQRQLQAQAAEYIAVEEEALDAQALPAGRREQVLRYFTALREKFEDSE